MKYFLLLFTLFTITLNAQNTLKFDKRNVQCEDKWIAYQIDKDSTYTFGFIYIDSQAGLTLNYEGKFKIDNKGKFNRIESDTKKEVGFMKVRLQPNKTTIAEIPESKFKELNIEKTPNWLTSYKTDENSVGRLYRWGYMYNSWNECEKALTFLEKAEKIDQNFKGLQTELAFSYNALEKFEKAEISLKKAIAQNPKDCYTYKELAYTYTKLINFKKVAETYSEMSKICTEQNFVQETAYNLAYEYFKAKDKANFKKWKIEAEKWSKTENQYTKNLSQMETELNK
jgi:tetratricopeptide (TPR) repeat protein